MDKVDVEFGRGVQVEWLDSSLGDGWEYGFKPHKPGAITSLGMVVANSEDALSISSHVALEQKGTAAVFTIPWGSIKSIEVLPDDFSLLGPQ